MENIIVTLLYRFFKILNSFKMIPAFINTDKNLLEDEKAKKYFFYEYEKSPRFDNLHKVNLSGRNVLEIGVGYGGYLFHILKSQAAFAYGIDVDEYRVQKAKELIAESYEGKNFSIQLCDAREMSWFQNESIDLVLSDAVIEHIRDRKEMFAEISRILKKDGVAFLSTSPIWFTWNGGHLARYIPVPWIHLLLPDSIILKILKKQKQKNDFPEKAIDNMIIMYETIGKLSIRRLEKEIGESALQLVSLKNVSNHPLKKLLNRFPVLEEFFAGDIQVMLKKK